VKDIKNVHDIFLKHSIEFHKHMFPFSYPNVSRIAEISFPKAFGPTLIMNTSSAGSKIPIF
jgi:hypothetical protein